MTYLYYIIYGPLKNSDVFEMCFNITVLRALRRTSKNNKIEAMLADRIKSIPATLGPLVKNSGGVKSFDYEWLGRCATVDQITYLRHIKHDLGRDFFATLVNGTHPEYANIPKKGSLFMIYQFLRNCNFAALEAMPPRMTLAYEALFLLSHGNMSFPLNGGLSFEGCLFECLMVTSRRESLIYALEKLNDQLSGDEPLVYSPRDFMTLRELMERYIGVLESQIAAADGSEAVELKNNQAFVQELFDKTAKF